MRGQVIDIVHVWPCSVNFPASDQGFARFGASKPPSGLRLSEVIVICPVRWILDILHNPRYHMPCKLWFYSILSSCRI